MQIAFLLPESFREIELPFQSSMEGQDKAAGSEPAPQAAADSAQSNLVFEEIHRKCRDIFPIFFDGAKVMVQKGLSSHFQISHTLSISPTSTGYRFGTTYVGTKQTAPGEAFPIFLGDTDIHGNTSATILHHFWRNYRAKFQGQVQQGKINAAQFTLERRGPLSTFGLTVANPNLINSSGLLVGHYMRRITNRLDMGAELVWQTDPKIPGRQISALSYAARYTAPFWTASATIGANNIHACYYHKQAENLQFGVEFESNIRLQEAITTLAYQVEIPDDIVMRASVDTNWTVGAVLEKKLSRQLPFTLALSGMLNHVKSQGKFGIGLIIGG